MEPITRTNMEIISNKPKTDGIQIAINLYHSNSTFPD
jgi:hypothetical protein